MNNSIVLQSDTNLKGTLKVVISSNESSVDCTAAIVDEMDNFVHTNKDLIKHFNEDSNRNMVDTVKIRYNLILLFFKAKILHFQPWSGW